jgi:phosphoribosylanthranilate isomerase
LRSAHAFLGAGVDAFVLDAATPQGFGGQGICPSWELATELVHRVEAPCFLAGGLTPDNVASAIAVVRPFGVDVSSGVEVTAGIKDPEKIRQFCRRAKGGKA